MDELHFLAADNDFLKFKGQCHFKFSKKNTQRPNTTLTSIDWYYF
jgi:hypothetical protein